MSKIIYLSCFLFYMFLVTSGQKFVDELGNDIDNSEDNNELNKLKLEQECLDLLKKGADSCKVDILAKLKRSKLAKDVAKAKNDLARLAELETQTSCCTAYLTIDCMETVAKHCGSADQETVKNMFQTGLDEIEKTKCVNYGYHSEKCNLDRYDNDPEPTLSPDIKKKIGLTCQTKIQNGINNCRQTTRDKLEQSGLTDDSVRTECCGTWYMVDSEKELIEGCDTTEGTLLKYLTEKIAQIENDQCTSYLYHNTDCSGTSTISLNLISVILLLCSIVYLIKLK